MTWVGPLLTAQAAGQLSALEVWDTVLACADCSDPLPVVEHLLAALGLPIPAPDLAPDLPTWLDEPIVVLNDDEMAQVI
jgi:hypothetical protein